MGKPKKRGYDSDLAAFAETVLEKAKAPLFERTPEAGTMEVTLLQADGTRKSTGPMPMGAVKLALKAMQAAKQLPIAQGLGAPVELYIAAAVDLITVAKQAPRRSRRPSPRA